MAKGRPRKNRTFAHLAGSNSRSGAQQIDMGARPWGNPSTFIDRLSFKVHEPNEEAFTKFHLTLRKLSDDVDVFLDSSMWDERLDKKIWAEIVNHSRVVKVVPQVRIELQPWLEAHPTARASRALTASAPVLEVVPPPSEGSSAATAQAY
jgi:hypothetical protein